MGYRGAPGGKRGSPRNPGWGWGGSGLSGIFRQGTEAVKAGVMEAKTHLGPAQDPTCQTKRKGRKRRLKGALVNCVELLMLELKPEYEDALN